MRAEGIQDAFSITLPLGSKHRRTGLTRGGTKARLSATNWGVNMAKLALIYGMRLLPEEDLGEVKDATVVLKNGRTTRVTMHLIEGSKEEIESTLRQSIQAFFEMYPEI
jgi:hypothetical protein